ncbi:SDR family NAD(P)-dependent oxidoreductase [Streptomyces chartreusis]|uniref:SDR family oxidoreductase n=1 Tax=Streptomyces chartreusis TaxID=1969 RepID=A0A7H8T1F1_STRCX|nr:SDR family oxidoreductase [Streptomyces chartreusis]QKZ17315.1 SDR family oxidoreductase [Streptomyces chartreusis]
MSDRPTAVVTGASSGIGAATARALAAAGFHVVLGARRLDRLNALAKEIEGTARPLDVSDKKSVAEFVAAVPECRVLVNNAGGAKGLDTVEHAQEEDWTWMFEVNVLGTLRLVQGLMPKLRKSGEGHIITVTSIAALQAYDKGAGYTGAKHAQAMLHRTLRGELLGEPIRLTEILPGAVETEFSLVRFEGDQEKADTVYKGFIPLAAEDVADVIAFAVTRPSHVNLDQIVIKPLAQADAMRTHRQD